MNILLSGATGFVGRHILNTIESTNLAVIGRSRPTGFKGDFLKHEIGTDKLEPTALTGIDIFIHSAARAHVMEENESDPLGAYRQVNTYGTLHLAEQAAKAGVKRFIFISSIKVNGEQTLPGQAFHMDDIPEPQDPYGVSKLEAEVGLQQIAQDTGMEVVILRPPLIYGQGVKANFAALMNLVKKGVPLPFRSIKRNKRSMVSVCNLVDLIVLCTKHPSAANQIFLVSDNNDLSTSEMVSLMAKVNGKPNLSIPVPTVIFETIGKILNKKDVVSRLTGSLQVDISYTMRQLQWEPPYNSTSGFKKAADSI